LIYATPNGGNRSAATGAFLKKEGVIAGVPDLFVADGRPGLYIEMKAAKGRLSITQKVMIARLKKAGYPVAVAFGWDEARAALQDYLNADHQCQ
jgi:hypothetical protein